MSDDPRRLNARRSPAVIETWTQDPSGADRFTCRTRPGIALSYRDVVTGPRPACVHRDVIVTDLVVRFRR